MSSKKSLILLFVTAASLTFMACQSAPPEEKVYPYPFETAVIDYSMQGYVEGTGTVYIKGNKSANETHVIIKNSQKEESMDSLLIDNGEYSYQIDLNKNTGTVNKNAIYQELKRLTLDKRMEFIIKNATGSMGASGSVPVPESQEQIAGQKCDMYKIPSLGQVCLWYGKPLSSRIDIPGMGITNELTATKVQMNVDIPDSRFDIPSGVKLDDPSKK